MNLNTGFLKICLFLHAYLSSSYSMILNMNMIKVSKLWSCTVDPSPFPTLPQHSKSTDFSVAKTAKKEYLATSERQHQLHLLPLIYFLSFVHLSASIYLSISFFTILMKSVVSLKLL